MSTELNQPVGRFRITSELMRDKWRKVSPTLRDFAIVRAECLFAQGVIEYTAFSEHFEPIPQHCSPPLYNLIMVVTTPDGDIEFLNVERIEG